MDPDKVEPTAEANAVKSLSLGWEQGPRVANPVCIWHEDEYY